jgi:hypothetical protein
MFYYSRTKTKLDEKRWKNIKTYKWTDTSKELLIEALEKFINNTYLACWSHTDTSNMSLT